MNDAELDELLAGTFPDPPSKAASGAAARVADSIGFASTRDASPADPARRTCVGRGRRGRPRRRRLVLLGGVVAVVVALSGAGTVAAYQLSIPPFQTIEPGLERATEPIPLVFNTLEGQRTTCLVFPEFHGLEPGQLDDIDERIRDQDWTLTHQAQLLGLTPATLTEPRAEMADEAFSFRVYTFVLPAAQGLRYRIFDDDPTFTGYGASCREDQS